MALTSVTGAGLANLFPRATALLSSWDAGVKIGQLWTGKSAGMGISDLITGNIHPGRELSTGEKLMGGVEAGLFFAATATTLGWRRPGWRRLRKSICKSNGR